MNLLGLSLTSVGNHEFDEGEDELKRMQNGGCHPTDGCQDGTGFAGAKFKYLSANVIDTRTGKPFFKPYAIRRFQGKKVGFIGMTLEGTPGIVSPSGITHLKFADEADTANHYARVLKRRGVKAIVVLLHQGGFQSVPFNTDTINTCTGFSGDVTDIVNRTTKAVGVFITGHTHAAVQLRDRRPAGDERELERAARDRPRADARAARRHQGRQRRQRADLRRGPYAAGERAGARRPLRRAVGAAAEDAGGQDRARHHAQRRRRRLGRERGRQPDRRRAARGHRRRRPRRRGGRADEPGRGARRLHLRPERHGEGDGVVTYEEAFTVQPFNNIVATQTFTGAQVLDVLKDQWCGTNTSQTVLLPSSSIHYSFSKSVAGEHPRQAVRRRGEPGQRA